MKLKHFAFATILGLPFISSCGSSQSNTKETQNTATDTPAADLVQASAGQVNLPAPFATESVNNYCDVQGWPQGLTPKAPDGFKVTRFADGLQNPRWIYIGPNGDIFVCETNGKNNIIQAVKATVAGKVKSGNVDANMSANRITLFRDANNDGMPESRTVFLTGLNHPLGMLILNNMFYVANNDGVVAYPYQVGQTSIAAKPKKITDLPGGSGHWTRNLVASADGSKIYVAVGSGSNVADDGLEKEEGKAMIWVMNPDGTDKKPYATGIRNPVGLAWAPGTSTLWTAVNERDGLGDDLVPDYLTSVKEGGFYGWPFSYWGSHEDPRMKDKQRPDMVQKAIVPDVSMGAHTASLGLAFDEKNTMAGKYKGGAFIGQHGSWNRSKPAGYAVVFVPFKGGKAAGPMQPFLTGFVADSAENKVYGRPVGLTFTAAGDMLVADDVSNIIWRVSAAK